MVGTMIALPHLFGLLPKNTNNFISFEEYYIDSIHIAIKTFDYIIIVTIHIEHHFSAKITEFEANLFRNFNTFGVHYAFGFTMINEYMQMI